MPIASCQSSSAPPASSRHSGAIRFAPIAKPMRSSWVARASAPAKYPASARSATLPPAHTSLPGAVFPGDPLSSSWLPCLGRPLGVAARSALPNLDTAAARQGSAPAGKEGQERCYLLSAWPFLTSGPAGYPLAMSTSPLLPDDVRAAAEVLAELGPDYHDAVMESFLAKVDREVDARVDVRLAAERRANTPEPRTVAAERQRAWTTGLASGLIGGTVAAGVLPPDPIKQVCQ